MALCKHMQKSKEGRIEEFEQSPRGELQRTTSAALKQFLRGFQPMKNASWLMSRKQKFGLAPPH
jgi:hypothetical protein